MEFGHSGRISVSGWQAGVDGLPRYRKMKLGQFNILLSTLKEFIDVGFSKFAVTWNTLHVILGFTVDLDRDI